MDLISHRHKFYPKQDFPEKEKKKNIAEFKGRYSRTLEMLEEIKDRIPWQRDITDSLMRQIEQKGRLSPKQRSFVTSLYLDSVIKSDADIREQAECRKLCLRLLQLRLGATRHFVESVATYTYDHPFSPLQMKSIRKIADKRERDLATIPDFNITNFDGWREFTRGAADVDKA